MRYSLRVLTVLVAWSVVGFAACAEGNENVEPADYAWGTPERIDTVGLAQEPRLAVNADGVAGAAWIDWDVGKIWTNQYTPDEGWGTAQSIETASEGFASSSPPPEVAIAEDGSAMIVWAEYQPDAVWSSHFAPSSGWSAAAPRRRCRAPRSPGAGCARRCRARSRRTRSPLPR